MFKLLVCALVLATSGCTRRFEIGTCFISYHLNTVYRVTKMMDYGYMTDIVLIDPESHATNRSLSGTSYVSYEIMLHDSFDRVDCEFFFGDKK
jgi:hypothetical protein